MSQWLRSAWKPLSVDQCKTEIKNTKKVELLKGQEQMIYFEGINQTHSVM